MGEISNLQKLKLYLNLFDLRDYAMIGVAVLLIFVQVVLEIEMPGYMSGIVTMLYTGGTPSQVVSEGGKMLVCALGSLISALLTGLIIARFGTELGYKLREAIFSKTLGFGMEEMGRFSTASLITRNTNDIMQVQVLFVLGLQVLIKAPVMALFAITKILGKSWEWTAATAVGVLVLIALMAVVILVAIPKSVKIQKLTDNLNRVTRENLTGIRVVRAYNAEGFEEEKFENANTDLTGANMFVNKVMSVVWPSLELLMLGLTTAIYVIGAYLIDGAGADVAYRLSLYSDMIVFSQYAMMIIGAFIALSMIVVIAPRALVAAGRIAEVLTTDVNIKDGAESEGLEGHDGEVEFRNVSFGYPGSKDAFITDVSFTAKKGETVALIGATGCGKSTIINLIPRFYDATYGTVLVDGKDVRDYDLHSLRDKIGYVSQKAVMFSGTVASNVSYGTEDATDDMIERAIDIAQGTDFVEKMDGEIDARISQGGMNVSGGQKQRLCIARAVCKQPEIYIFDDSFSALDYRTDKILRRTLREKMGDATVILVAQRIGTIRDADRILVIEDGRIVGNGKHDDLIQTCPTYREIALSQLSEDEV